MSTQTRRFLILGSVLLALVVAGTGAYFFRESQRARQMTESREEGLRLYAEEKYEQAMPRLSYFTSRDKTDPEVLYALADCRWRIPLENGRHLVSAINFLRPAAELTPGDQKPLTLLLELYTRVGFTTEILDTADRLLALDPGNVDALQVRIAALQRLGRTEHALTAAQSLADRTPGDVNAHEAVLYLMTQLRRPPEELKAYADGVSAAHPDRAEMTVLRSRIALIQGDFERAREIAREAAQQQIGKPEALPIVMRYLDVIGLFAEADRILEGQMEIDDRRTVAQRLKAERLWKTGRPDEAVALLRPLLDPPSGASDNALGLAAMMEQFSGPETFEIDAAETLRSRSSRQASAWLSWLNARTALVEGRRDDARQLLEQIPPQTVGSEFVSFLEARARASSGEHAAALEHYRAAIRTEPRWLEARLAAIDSAIAADDPGAAFTLAQDTANYFPDRLAAVLSLARTGAALAEAGRAGPEQLLAVRTLLGQLEQEPVDQSELMSLRARVDAATGDSAGARRAIERLLELGPQASPGALADALRVAQRIGAEDLMNRIDAAGAQGPLDPDLVYARATTAAAQGRVVEGAALLRKAVEDAPPAQKLGFRRALAIYLNRVGDPEGVPMLTALAAEYPSDLQVQMDLLSSDRMWTSRDLVQPSLDRVKALAGERSTAWRLYEARRLLTFDRSQAGAAEAARILGDIIRDEPTNATAMALMGDSMMVLNDPAAAIENLGRSIDANPSQLSLYPTLIALLQRQGETDAAQRRLTEFMRFTDIPDELRRQRMRQAVFQAMWAEAEADLRVLAARGAEADRLQLAEFLVMRGRPDEARAEYESLLESPEPGSNTLMQAADFLAFAGESERASELLDTLCARLSPIQAELLRAGFDERHGKVRDAESRLRAAVKSTDDPAASAELARFLIRQDRPDDAVVVVDEALQSHGDDEILRSLRTMFQQASGARTRPEDADDGLEPAALALIEANKERPSPAGDFGPYLERLRKLTSDHPTFFAGWQTLVGALFEANQPAEAVNAARVALRVLPADPRAAQLATQALETAGQSAEALAAARAWRDLSHLNPLAADLTLGRLLAQDGRAAEARRYLDPHRDAIAQLGAREPTAIALYASVLTASGALDDARAFLSDARQNGPAWGLAYIGAAKPMLRNTAAARAWLQDASRFADESNPDVRLELGRAWFELAGASGSHDDFRQAIATLSPLRDDPERRVEAARVLATAHDRIGELKEAEAQYREILRADPDQPVILNNLAYLLTRTDPKGDEATALVSRALDIVREQGVAAAVEANFLDTLGNARLARGDAEGAARAYRDAMTLAPDEPELVAGLAFSLLPQATDQRVASELRVLVERFDRIAGRRPVSETARTRMTQVRAALK